MNRLVAVIFSLFLVYSCGEYQKVLKSDDFNYKYAKAVEYYTSKDYNKALPLFKELTTVLMGTQKMQEIGYYYAYCHYAIKDYITAAYLFKKYARDFKNGKHHEECSYMAAYCYYLEVPTYSLDATNNYKAIKELQAFINLYPDSKRVEECNGLIDELTTILSKKAFEIGKQYYITENYKAAIISLNNVLIDFPSYDNREETYYLIVKSTYELAINSIEKKINERLQETISSFEQFVDNYPESRYLNELQDVHIKAANLLAQNESKK